MIVGVKPKVKASEYYGASCVQNLVNKLGGNRKVIAWEGEVKVFANGHIESTGWKELRAGQNAQNITSPIGRAGMAASGKSVLLGEIKTTEGLVYFLNEINEATQMIELEHKGIKVLFRGTTRNVDNSLFIGNPNSQSYGISSSTDPNTCPK